MKPTFLSSLLAVVMLAWGPPSQAQDCSTEVLATLTTQMWGGEISYTISDDNGGDGDGTASLAGLNHSLLVSPPDELHELVKLIAGQVVKVAEEAVFSIYLAVPVVFLVKDTLDLASQGLHEASE